MSSFTGLTYLKIHVYFWATADLLARAGFIVELAICDGASYNAKFIRFNCGGTLRTPWCFNPFSRAQLVFLFDSPHSLKNNRNNLFKSTRDCKPHQFSMSHRLIRILWAELLKERAARNSSKGMPPDVWIDDEEKQRLKIWERKTESLRKLLKNERVATAAEAENGRAFFGWYRLVDISLEHERLRKIGISSPIDKELTIAALELTNFSKMNVKLALRVCDPKVISAFMATISRLTQKRDALPADSSTRAQLERDLMSFKATVLYLSAMRKMYCNFGMARRYLHGELDPLLTELANGYRFFHLWRLDVESLVGVLDPVRRKKHFLHQTTWSQLESSFAGMLLFVRRRFEAHPGCQIWPRRLSQSCLESLFGQLRGFCRGTGQLDARSYAKYLSKVKCQYELKLMRRNNIDPDSLSPEDALRLVRWSNNDMANRQVDQALNAHLAALNLDR